MIKRILAGAAAAGFALSLLGAGSATAAPCTSETAPNGGVPVIATSPTGTVIYGAGGTSGGYIGARGNNGWLQASGSSTGATVSGNSTPEALEGTVTVSATPNACVNGTDAV